MKVLISCLTLKPSQRPHIVPPFSLQTLHLRSVPHKASITWIWDTLFQQKAATVRRCCSLVYRVLSNNFARKRRPCQRRYRRKHRHSPRSKALAARLYSYHAIPLTASDPPLVPPPSQRSFARCNVDTYNRVYMYARRFFTISTNRGSAMNIYLSLSGSTTP